MPERSNAKALTTYEWVALPNSELKQLGHDPEDRVHYTGHRALLQKAYLPTIGNWGRLETGDLVNTKNPSRGLVKVRYTAFRQFRHSRGLMTGSKFELLHGSVEHRPWLHAQLAWREHRRIQQLVKEGAGTYCSLGIAAEQIASAGTKRSTPDEQRLGMLPIEIVTWARLFDFFLLTYGLPYDDWEEFDAQTKAKWWSTRIATNGAEPISLDEGFEYVGTRPAKRHLDSFDPAASDTRGDVSGSVRAVDAATAR